MPKEPHIMPSEIAKRSKSKKTKVAEPIPPPPDRPQQCKVCLTLMRDHLCIHNLKSFSWQVTFGWPENDATATYHPRRQINTVESIWLSNRKRISLRIQESEYHVLLIHNSQSFIFFMRKPCLQLRYIDIILKARYSRMNWSNIWRLAVMLAQRQLSLGTHSMLIVRFLFPKKSWNSSNISTRISIWKHNHG